MCVVLEVYVDLVVVEMLWLVEWFDEWLCDVVWDDGFGLIYCGVMIECVFDLV